MGSAAITSPSNARIRRLAALRDRKERDRESVFVVEGVRDVDRAVGAGLRPLEVYYDPGVFPGPPASSDFETAVSTAALDRASYRSRSLGVIAVFAQFDVTLDHLTLSAEPLILIAEAIEKPGNLGALLRTADAVGADALIAADPGADPFSPNVIRASTGAIFSVPLALGNLKTVIYWLQERAVRVVAADPGTGADLWSTDLTGPCALLVGSEHRGLSKPAIEAAEVTVAIPMHGQTDSLNVSVSMAILAYEAVRQRSNPDS